MEVGVLCSAGGSGGAASVIAKANRSARGDQAIHYWKHLHIRFLDCVLGVPGEAVEGVVADRDADLHERGAGVRIVRLTARALITDAGRLSVELQLRTSG